MFKWFKKKDKKKDEIFDKEELIEEKDEAETQEVEDDEIDENINVESTVNELEEGKEES